MMSGVQEPLSGGLGPVMPGYEEIFGADAAQAGASVLAPSQRAEINERLKAFSASPGVRDDALALYVNSQVNGGHSPRPITFRMTYGTSARAC